MTWHSGALSLLLLTPKIKWNKRCVDLVYLAQFLRSLVGNFVSCFIFSVKMRPFCDGWHFLICHTPKVERFKCRVCLQCLAYWTYSLKSDLIPCVVHWSCNDALNFVMHYISHHRNSMWPALCWLLIHRPTILLLHHRFCSLFEQYKTGQHKVWWYW